MIYEGHDSTSDEQRSFAELQDGSTIEAEVTGTDETDITVTLSGGEVDEGEQKWTYTEHDRDEVEGVAVDESTGTVFSVVGGFGDEVHAVDAETGTQEWLYDEHEGGVQSVAVDESTGTVFSGDDEAEVRAIDASDGTLKWTYTEHFNTVTGLAVDESTGTVFSTTTNNQMHAIDADTATQEWTYEEYDGGVMGVAVNESTGTVFSSGGSDDERVHAVDASDGTREWTYDEHTNNVDDVAVNESTGTVFSGSRDHEMHAIDAETGTQEWVYTEHSNNVNGVAVNESTGTVFSASRDEEVHAVDASDGTQEWTYSEHPDYVNDVAVDESTGTVFSVDDNEALHAISTLGEAVDPSLSMAGDTVSFDGALAENEEHTDTISNVAPDNYVGDVSLTDGALDIDLDWTEITITRDPTVSINSDDGTQDISHDGDIADGETVDVSDSIDESVKDILSESGTISIKVSDEVEGPVGRVGVQFIAGVTTAQIDHIQEDFDALVNEIWVTDDVQSLPEDTTIIYEVEDANGNVIEIDHDDVDTAIDNDVLETYEVQIRAKMNVTEIGSTSPELDSYSAYYSLETPDEYLDAEIESTVET